MLPIQVFHLFVQLQWKGKALDQRRFLRGPWEAFKRIYIRISGIPLVLSDPKIMLPHKSAKTIGRRQTAYHLIDLSHRLLGPIYGTQQHPTHANCLNSSQWCRVWGFGAGFSRRFRKECPPTILQGQKCAQTVPMAHGAKEILSKCKTFETSNNSEPELLNGILSRSNFCRKDS